jgi:hypothetical protein
MRQPFCFNDLLESKFCCLSEVAQQFPRPYIFSDKTDTVVATINIKRGCYGQTLCQYINASPLNKSYKVPGSDVKFFGINLLHQNFNMYI